MGDFVQYIGIALSLFFAFQVYKDAKNRKNEAAMFWAAATFIAWIFVLPVYWFKNMRE
ncbi:MAG: hypothetical protein GX084_03015 [Acholeplasmataceae bacterium]|nr:hypothetical protein [Acidaminococcaceae bacterium]NLY83570.1 hypothetical protein [Acholeplasmataceae bacterium]